MSWIKKTKQKTIPLCLLWGWVGGRCVQKLLQYICYYPFDKGHDIMFSVDIQQLIFLNIFALDILIPFCPPIINIPKKFHPGKFHNVSFGIFPQFCVCWSNLWWCCIAIFTCIRSFLSAFLPALPLFQDPPHLYFSNFHTPTTYILAFLLIFLLFQDPPPYLYFSNFQTSHYFEIPPLIFLHFF